MFLDVLALVGAAIVVLLWRRRQRFLSLSKGFPLPPGPPGKPVIGNLLDIPRHRAWHKFLEWKQEYGDMVYVEAIGNGILILNTIEAVNDLLDRRPSIYSDRPTFVMVGELMGLDNSIPMLQWGPTLKQHRKLTHITLSPEAVKKYHIVQEDIVTMYLKSLIDTPSDFVSQLRLTAGRIIMSVTYGLPVQTPDDIYITEAEDTMEMIGKATVPGAFLVDLLPFLKRLPSWVPFNTIPETGEMGRNKIYSMVSRPYEHVKQEHAAGTALPSFTLDCLESVKSGESKLPPDEADHIIRWAAGAMYGAGGESTYATILTFILAMAWFPDVQDRIREEIDQVVGQGRLPATQDRPNMPYVNATIKEALRWKSALPLSIARRTKTADFYNGYYIPEGTIVLPNVWAISKDDKSGIPSHIFSPERFLREDTKDLVTDPYSYAFGFGRRVCPGKYLGDNNLFLLISGLMASVVIVQKKGADGKTIPLNPQFTSGLVSHPEPFEVDITPRSPEAAAIVRERAAQVN
ncbi:hypothetical protein AX16_009060 [Volvariella volvacea WC 439]|nr:hypothetical protein AX16_009060 [Volvariella volvacea WC 439]